MRVDRASADAYRVMKGDEIIGMALKMSNGAWCAFDRDEKRLSRRQFKSPSAVKLWFEFEGKKDA